MNTSPNRPGPHECEDLARLLPDPVSRDLPSDRHQRLREFVMTRIEQEARQAEEAPRRSVVRRRPVLLSSVLTAATAAVAAFVIGIGGSDGPAGGDATPPPSAAARSGSQVLLVAASSAEKAPAGSGTYWHVSIEGSDASGPLETWTSRDGTTWMRGDKSGGALVKAEEGGTYSLAGVDVSLRMLRGLPADPGELRTWLTETVEKADIETGSGRPDAATKKRLVFNGLVSLVSQLPAPPKVRAGAFRAIASYPNVERLGPVKGGEGLAVTLDGRKVRLVVDPATSRVSNTNLYVDADGAEISLGGDSGATISTEWTETLPK